jgi:hypothetical protein
MGWDEKCAALRSLVDQFQLQLNDIVPSVLLRHVSRALPDTFCDRAAVALDAGSPAVSRDSPLTLGSIFVLRMCFEPFAISRQTDSDTRLCGA